MQCLDILQQENEKIRQREREREKTRNKGGKEVWNFGEAMEENERRDEKGSGGTERKRVTYCYSLIL